MQGALVVKTPSGFQLAALVKSVIVGMNYETKETILIPEEWKRDVMAFQGLVG